MGAHFRHIQTLFLQTLLFAALILFTHPAHAQDITTGLTNHFQLDEGSGTTTTDSVAGTVGTLTNGPTWTTGRIQNGVSFDNLDDFITVPNDASFNFTGDITVSAWINLNSLAGYHDVVVKGTNSSYDWFLETIGSEIEFAANDSGSAVAQTTGAGLTTGTWYHIAATFNDTTNTIVIYVNGTSIPFSFSNASGSLKNTVQPLRMGLTFTGEDFDGIIDEVRIYNRALTAADLAALYAYNGSTFSGPLPCNASYAGVVTYNDDENILQYCNATDWIAMGVGTGNWTPLSLTTAPTLWFDAADASTIAHTTGAVTTWTDKISGRIASLDGGSGSPAYSTTEFNGTYPGITFDGTDRMLGTITNNVSGDSTAFIVINSAGTNDGSGFGFGQVFSFNAGAAAWNNPVSYWVGMRLNTQAGRIQANGSSGAIDLVALNAAGDIIYGGVRSSADEVIGTQNAATPVTVLSRAVELDATSDDFYIGGDAGDDNFEFEGTIGEIIALDYEPSAAEREQIEGYLAHKWGLTTNLPGAHPYLASPPGGSGSGGSGTCTNPDGARGEIQYNATEGLLQYCNGANWIQIGAAITTIGTTPIISSTITAGQLHSCGIGTNIKAYCWGEGSSGQLGNGNTTDHNSPVEVLAGDNVAGTFTHVSAGEIHTCGIGTDQKAYCWGNGADGKLGDGDTNNHTTPVEVLAGENIAGTFTQINSGDFHSCGIGTDTKAYCWGEGSAGRLGDGGTTDQLSPVEVHSGANTAGTYTQISAAIAYTCGIGTDTKAYCWGSNSSGRLGDGNISGNQTTPVEVLAGENTAATYTNISTGRIHTCAVGTDQKAYCWGNGSFGELGDNGSANQVSPVEVHAGENTSATFTHIGAGQNFSCGISTNQKAYCWGGGGKLGGGSASSSTPIEVLAGENTAATYELNISLGDDHSCAIGTNKKAYCWGTVGALGNGSSVSSSTPVEVLSGEGSGSFGGAGPLCSNPDGAPGTLIYNTDFNIMQACDGVQWVSVGTTGTVPAGGPAPPTGCPTIGDACDDGTIYAGDVDYGSGPEKIYAPATEQGNMQWRTASKSFRSVAPVSADDGYLNRLYLSDPENIALYPAFETCDNLNVHGRDDWYLPAPTELVELFTNRAAINATATDNFTTGSYWSSEDTSDTFARRVNFLSGSQSASNQTSSRDVRCIRRQTPDTFAASPTNCPTIGDLCDDGSIFAGDTNLYVTNADNGESIQWKTSNGTDDINPDSNTDGEANNTNRSGLITDFPAFELCENLVRHNQNDWYLPAIDELTQLYDNRAAINASTTASFASGAFFSSTESGNNDARIRRFNDGFNGQTSKTSTTTDVRCVRRE